MSDLTIRKDRTIPDPKRRAFLRLSGDVTRELNNACKYRLAAGETQAEIARSVDQDPAFLSRVLSGVSGTNLRSIAAVLAATRHRLKIVAVPLEELTKDAGGHKVDALAHDTGAVYINMFKTGSGIWSSSDLVEAKASRTFTSVQTVMKSDTKTSRP